MPKHEFSPVYEDEDHWFRFDITVIETRKELTSDGFGSWHNTNSNLNHCVENDDISNLRLKS